MLVEFKFETEYGPILVVTQNELKKALKSDSEFDSFCLALESYYSRVDAICKLYYRSELEYLVSLLKAKDSKLFIAIEEVRYRNIGVAYVVNEFLPEKVNF